MAISRMQRSPLALLEWQPGAGAIDAQVKYLGQPAMHVAVEKLDFAAHRVCIIAQFSEHLLHSSCHRELGRP